MSQLKKTRSRIHLFSGALIMLLLALGFNALLTSATLEKLYVETFISKNNVVAKDLQRNLETALRFGKSLDKFIGMDKLIQEARQHLNPGDITGKPVPNRSGSESDIVISITRPDGFIVYSSASDLVGTQLPEPVRLSGVKDKTEASTTYSVKHKEIYYLSLPVKGGFTKKWVATVTVAFSQTQVKALLRDVMVKNLKLIGLIIICGILQIGALLKSVTLDHQTSDKVIKRIRFKVSITLFCVITLSQIIFSLFNLIEFRTHYLEISSEKSAVMSKLLKQDIEYLLTKGISIRRLVKMDQTLADVIAVSPELEGITISDNHEKPLYIATQHGMENLTSPEKNKKQENQIQPLKRNPGYFIDQNLINTRKFKSGIREGVLTIHISKEFLYNKLKEIALDSFTVLAISIFFFVELLILELQLVQRQLTAAPQIKKARIHYATIRPVAFMFFFGVDICISFLPLHMETLYNPAQPIFGLSKNIIMGLPISMQMLFTSISLLISGAWCDKRGWAEPFLIGLSLAGAGFLFAWLAPSSIYFLFALGLVGMGYGLSLMAAQGFVIAHTTTNNSAQGMAQLWAGVYAGSICGGAAGAMLADRIGYAPVFLVGGSILLLLIVYSLLMMKDDMTRPESDKKIDQAAQAGQTDALPKASVFKFLFSRKVFTLIVFYGLPWYIVLVGFMNYYSPIYLKSIGTSQSNIGRIFMIYGICLMYLAPFLSKLIGRTEDKKRYLIIGSFIGSLSIANFYFFKEMSGVLSVTISIFLLGLSACLIPVRSAYVLDFDITKQLGGGKAIGVLNAVLRLGQVTGPILFGWLFITMGSDSGIAVTAAAYLIFTMIFVLVG